MLTFLAILIAAVVSVQDTNMVSIPAGEFWMGRTHMFLLDELGMHLRPRLDDQPAHLVYLDSFLIDKYEVTNADYARFTEAKRYRKPFHWVNGKVPAGQEKFPVYNVSWDDAVAYCAFVGKRLPTEAEWERAARGGRAENTMYPWGDELRPRPAQRGGAPQPKLAHYGFPNGPAAVGSYPANDLGIFDVTGNVWEWVADWYGHSYYSTTPDINPKGPGTGQYRVIRGGGWSDADERLLALHYRNYTNPGHRTATVGFRCAR
jgi:formylglycine-generating enzyme required for sulfatase activity